VAAADEARLATPAAIGLLGDFFLDFGGNFFDGFTACLNILAYALDRVAGGERRDHRDSEQNGCEFFHFSIS